MNKKKYTGRAPALLLCLLLAAGALTACGNGRVVFTTGFGRDEVFRVGSQVCTLAEMRVYLTNAQNQYESVYGSRVWSVSRDGLSLEQNLKENILAKTAQIKAMYLLAQDKGVELNPGESKLVKRAAEEYYNSLSDREKELLGVEPVILERMYTEYALADKVYRYIIQDINPEISDDEARTITVQHILFRTCTVDERGKRVELSEGDRQKLYLEACEVRRQAAEDKADFLELAGRYSEDATITYSFGKGQIDEVFEETAFSLETGEISQVVETEAGYHIIKCITTFDRAETDANKLVIVEERRREVFGEEYDAFVEPLVRQLNTKLWDEITLLQDEDTDTKSFFEIYDKYFSGV